MRFDTLKRRKSKRLQNFGGLLMRDIIINPEYTKLVDPSSDEENEALKDSIKETNGNVVPVLVNKNGVVSRRPP